MKNRLRLTLTALLAGAFACAATIGQAATGGYTPATPEPGADIPKATVKFGMRPYADNTYFVVGMEKGWFKDVGIEISPPPYGLKMAETQWVSLLLNHQVDVDSATCSMLLPSYKTTDQLKCVGFAVTFYGSVMLANPKLKLKRVSDYIAEGLPFKEALKKALEPLVGKKVYAPAEISDKVFSELPFKLAGLALPDYTTMEDPQMLLLAKSGRADFVHPNGAPIAQTLLDAGWTPVYDIGQLVKNGPGGVDSPLEPLVFNNGWAATADYVDAHKTTMLRFSSVVFRIFDALKKDPSLFGAYTPYLNSVAGTSLTPDGVKRTVLNLDPFVTFEEQKRYFVDKDSPEYYGNSMGALIKSLELTKSIPQGLTAAEVEWAAPMYLELLDYQKKSDALFEKAKAAEPTGEKKALMDKAHEYYSWFDFLDSYRAATAAMAN